MFQIPHMKMKTINTISLLMLLALHSARAYENEKIKKSSGLYFNNLGEVKLSNQKFTLLTYTNLSLIEDQVKLANDQYDKSLGLCSKINTQFLILDCNTQLHLLGRKLKSIKNDYAIISHQLYNIRKKRGLLNIGGEVLRWLFGTPDSDDAQFYTDSIKSLINNERETHILMQKQIGIISSTITNFNESTRKLNADADSLNENLAKFNRFVKQTTKNEEKLNLEFQINNHILTLAELTNEIQISLKNYLNDITLIRHGIINFNLVHPQDLQTELEKIQTKYTLPLTPTLENTYIYYNLMKVKSFISQKLLVISLDIPLIISNQYNLYRIYSLPTPHLGEPRLYSYIEPSKPYLLVSTTKTVYSTMSNLDQCKEYQPNSWLCEGVSTSRRTSSSTCETQLFFEQTGRIPDSCTIRKLYADLEIWHKIRPNQWLYVLSKPTTINIICQKSEDGEETLRKIGILQLDPECKAYSENVILETEFTQATANITNRIPSIDITKDDCCVKLRENITLENVRLHPIKLSNLNLEELQFAQKKLSEIDETLQQQLNQPFIIKHSSWFTSTLSIIGITFSLFATYKILKWLGFFSMVRNFIACNTPGSKNSTCVPCVQVFTHCFNKSKQPQTEFNVQYDAELERLNYPKATSHAEPKVPRYATRRATRSTTSGDSIGNQVPFKITSQ